MATGVPTIQVSSLKDAKISPHTGHAERTVTVRGPPGAVDRAVWEISQVLREVEQQQQQHGQGHKQYI